MQIIERNDSVFIKFPFFVASIYLENVMLGQMLRAVVPISAVMRQRTLFSDIYIRFFVGVQNFFGAVKISFDDFVFVRNEILYVVDSEKLFNVDFALPYVFVVYADNVRISLRRISTAQYNPL